MKIKICGLRRLEDVEYVNSTKPDYVGFILAEGFRRTITLDTARELKKNLNPDILAVGVFVNDAVEKVIACLEEGLIDIAQLHGEETEEDILYIKAVTGKPVIKTVKAVDRYLVEAWLDSAADYLLFDSGTGTGKTFDWSMLEDIDREFFLAGGLSCENAEAAVKQARPYALDVSSGVETDGVKDFSKIKEMIEIVRKITD